VIHICIPAHNEERTIGVLLWKVRKVMADFARDYRILVLDDASTDRTSETLQRYVPSLPLRIFREEERVGYPRALERLLREAVAMADYPKRDSVVTLQADFTESPEYIVPLVKTLEGGADIVAGRLPADTTPLPGPMRLTRWAASLLLSKTLRDAPVSDPLCGYRAYRVIVLKKALRSMGDEPILTGEGWAANLELLGLVAPHARRIEETPLDMRFDIRHRESRFRPVRTFRSIYQVRGRDPWKGVEGSA
jgi:glycosyltransferase involved in cell wall biosynthesis